MRTLIVLDNTPVSEGILQCSAQLSEKIGSDSTALMVIPHGHPGMFDQAKAILNQTRNYPSLVGLQRKIRVGSLAREIQQECLEGNYQILMLGAHPHHVWGWKSPKTPLARIVEEVPCSTLVVKGLVPEIKKVLLCDSGAPSTLYLRDFSSQVIGLLKDVEQVTVLHVMSQVSAGPGIPGEQLRSDAEKLIQAHTPEGDLLDHDVQNLVLHGFHPTPKVRHGLVVDEILDEASSGGYDLVIIGANTAAGWQKILLENLAKKITEKIDRSLLIVRPDPNTTQGITESLTVPDLNGR
jgi:nucleotide-binding universal stress UspA family protein